MSRIFLAFLILTGISSCGINRQAQQIKALEKCTYHLVDATNITVAGTDIKKLINANSLNLANVPSLAFAYLRKDIPLQANLNLEISNPSGSLAAINDFEYRILINQQEIANGTVDQRVSIAAGETVRVPLKLNANIYQLISNGKIMEDVSKFLSGATSGVDQKGMVTLKIKPSILVGGELVKYPGYFTVSKEISSKILL